jgi:DNA-binding transcriptional ArsR family regulator
MRDDPATVSRLAKVLAHEVCVRLLDELTAGEATVSDLVCRLGVAQPSISSHLTLLRESGMVRVEDRGRQRVYALNGEPPALVLASLRTLAAAVAPPRARAAERAVKDDAPIRRARTCYDHLAGVVGVRLLDGLLGRRWLEPRGERGYAVTGAGTSAFEALGVDVQGASRARRAFAPGCLDWTERRPHLGGALGAALLRRCCSPTRRPSSRVSGPSG